jgi:hypothetical protein
LYASRCPKEPPRSFKVSEIGEGEEAVRTGSCGRSPLRLLAVVDAVRKCGGCAPVHRMTDMVAWVYSLCDGKRETSVCRTLATSERFTQVTHNGARSCRTRPPRLTVEVDGAGRSGRSGCPQPYAGRPVTQSSVTSYNPHSCVAVYPPTCVRHGIGHPDTASSLTCLQGTSHTHRCTVNVELSIL